METKCKLLVRLRDLFSQSEKNDVEIVGELGQQ